MTVEWQIPDEDPDRRSSTQAEVFFAAELPRLQNYVTSRIGTGPDVDDIVQEAATRLLQRWVPDAKHRRNLLYVIARGLVADLQRDRARGPIEISLTALPTEPPAEPAPVDSLSVTDSLRRRRVLDDALTALGDNRQLVIDKAMHGASYDTLASRYQLSMSAVYKRVPRALAQLRAALKSSGAFLLTLIVRARTAAHRSARNALVVPLAQAAGLGLLISTVATSPLATVPTVRIDVRGAEATMVAAAREATDAEVAPTEHRASPTNGSTRGSSPTTALAHVRAAGGPIAQLPEDPPAVCADRACVGGNEGDVLTVDVVPGRPVSVTEGYVRLCQRIPSGEPIPSQDYVTCHTNGDPPYQDPPPPGHVTGG